MTTNDDVPLSDRMRVFRDFVSMLVEFWQTDCLMRGEPVTADGTLAATRAVADETLDLVGDAMGDTACIIEVPGPDGGPMLDLCPSRYADTAPAMTRH